MSALVTRGLPPVWRSKLWIWSFDFLRSGWRVAASFASPQPRSAMVQILVEKSLGRGMAVGRAGWDLGGWRRGARVLMSEM